MTLAEAANVHYLYSTVMVRHEGCEKHLEALRVIREHARTISELNRGREESRKGKN